MNHTLELHLNNSPEVLERVLRVARHRGFAVQLMNWLAGSEQQQPTLQLTVSSERPIHLLNNQLEKLFDVVAVNTLSSELHQAKLA